MLFWPGSMWIGPYLYLRCCTPGASPPQVVGGVSLVCTPVTGPGGLEPAALVVVPAPCDEQAASARRTAHAAPITAVLIPRGTAVSVPRRRYGSGMGQTMPSSDAVGSAASSSAATWAGAGGGSGAGSSW